MGEPLDLAELDGPFRMEWRGQFENAELERLHEGCFPGEAQSTGWWEQVNRHSFGWICLRHQAQLAGFVNLPWDGGHHCFVMDLMVAPAFQRSGWAARIMREVVVRVKDGSCQWLHVDFAPHLRSLYFDTCDFTPTDAGLIHLR